MAREEAAILGSGTIPFMPPILHTSLGGTHTTLPADGPAAGKGVRMGSQVVVSNHEDFHSAPSFMVSGVNVGTAAVQVWAPDLHEALLRRRRSIVVQNQGPGEVYVGHNSSVGSGVTQPGFLLEAAPAGGSEIELPIMGGASVWAVSNAEASTVVVLVY